MDTRTTTALSQHLETALSLAQGNPSPRGPSPATPKITSKAALTAALTRAQKYAHPPAKAPASCAQEPIRTVHHLSCTGGTLIAKCLASMANTMVLNEVDPLSALPLRGGLARFTPTDMTALVRQSGHAIPDTLLSDLFIANLRVLHAEQWKIGRALILRDHSHSHFLYGDTVRDGPTLHARVAAHFPVRSIVTVRDPIDSYISMQKQGWHTQFSPPSFEEYCRRYLLFLEAHEDIPIIKYEDFVKRPKQVMRRICKLLNLDYYPGFTEDFSAFQFSGDSGRGGDVIRKQERPALAEPEILIGCNTSSSPSYISLLKKTGYDQIAKGSDR